MLGQKGRFNQEMSSYRSDEASESVFKKAKSVYINEIHEHKQKNIILMWVLCGSLFINGVLGFGNVYLSTNSYIKTYFIEVDSSSGAVRNVGLAQDGQYVPKEEFIKNQVGLFIEKVRSVPLDPILYKKNWNEAKMVMTNGAASKITDIMNNDLQMAKALGKKTVLPTIISIVPITKDSYQCRWTEEHFVINGNGAKDNVIMNGIVTVEFTKPQSEEELRINPMGIRIKDISWAPEKK